MYPFQFRAQGFLTSLIVNTVTCAALLHWLSLTARLEKEQFNVFFFMPGWCACIQQIIMTIILWCYYLGLCLQTLLFNMSPFSHWRWKEMGAGLYDGFWEMLHSTFLAVNRWSLKLKDFSVSAVFDVDHTTTLRGNCSVAVIWRQFHCDFQGGISTIKRLPQMKSFN